MSEIACHIDDDEWGESRLKIVVEPGGAVALASTLTGKLDCRGRTVGIVCSGGNMDPETFRRVLAEA